MRKLSVLCGMAALALWATPASATPITDACPRLNGGFSGGTAVDPTYQSNAANLGTANGGCNVLVTFGANGSITTTHPNTQAFYDDGRDDNMIGIVNNSGAPITSIFLSSGSFAIFNFDGDGVCGTAALPGSGGGVPGYTASNGSMATFCGISDSSGYLPEGITKTGANIFEGTVNFAGGIPNGQAAFFSLEGPVDQNLVVGNPTTGTTPTVPEPTSLLLLGTGILAFARRMRKA